jgi:hypothetical protein
LDAHTFIASGVGVGLKNCFLTMPLNRSAVYEKTQACGVKLVT